MGAWIIGLAGSQRSEVTPMPDAWLEELSDEECLELLRSRSVGRIAFNVDGLPFVMPVNYRLVEAHGKTPGAWIALRTRPGNVIDRASDEVAFEIDNVDMLRQDGWSVLVRGTVHEIDPDAAHVRERFDSNPWIAADRDAWLIIDPYAVTGRRLHAPRIEWAFNAGAYL
jgi:nitroimidazol reductase NimA-like FMN-containing flavoprotein (pyridoxamine 5'-phosphate oxidase superfamily)